MEREYKILVFSDMHGNRRAVDIAEKILEKDGHDMAVYLGDFSEKIGDEKANAEDAEHLINRLKELTEVKALFGNCDTPELRKLLEEQGISLHGKLIFLGKTAIAGWGGSHPTPFHTPSELSEAEIKEGLTGLMDEAAEKGAEKLVLLTHEPPANTTADELPDGHVGSGSLRHIIEKYQPNLNACGHIHEAKSTDHVGQTKVVNVGPASEGHFLSIAVDGSVETEEISV